MELVTRTFNFCLNCLLQGFKSPVSNFINSIMFSLWVYSWTIFFTSYGKITKDEKNKDNKESDNMKMTIKENIAVCLIQALTLSYMLSSK